MFSQNWSPESIIKASIKQMSPFIESNLFRSLLHALKLQNLRFQEDGGDHNHSTDRKLPVPSQTLPDPPAAWFRCWVSNKIFFLDSQVLGLLLLKGKICWRPERKKEWVKKRFLLNVILYFYRAVATFCCKWALFMKPHRTFQTAHSLLPPWGILRDLTNLCCPWSGEFLRPLLR